jgi:hypothetical protein
LKKICDEVPNYNMKTILGDLSTEVGEDSYLYPARGGHSLHKETNHNGKHMVNFALGRDIAVTGSQYHTRTFTK